MENGFISLGKQNESIGIASPVVEKTKVYYPSLYLNDVEIGLDEEDVGEEMTVMCKVKVNRVTTTMDKKKTTQSIDLEVMGIKFDVHSEDKEDS